MVDALTRANIATHREWLGFVQPVGLVVAEPVLVERGVILDRHARPRQERFKELLDGDEQRFTEIRALFTDFLGWEEDDLAEPAAELHVRLPELGVTLEPSFAVADPDGGTQLLIRLEPDGTGLDDPVPERVDGWTASLQARFERLLRQTEIPTGLLCTPEAVRLVYVPKGETSGHVTFRVADMATVMGRPILAALDLLLGAYRLSRAPARERLSALLEASREAQNTVSTKLARQVLGSLYELLRGFVAADGRDPEHRLQTVAQQRPEDLYGGLVTALMRLVFILYAEDRDLMPQDPVYEQHYGLRGLFAKLREDAAQHGDLMDRRYGAWARLLALFRLIHKGGGHEGLRFVARKGRLFDPDAYPFLEGSAAPGDPPGHLPMVPDGTVWRVLERLLVLGGERLSYRTLDVEQIGSVYEVVMGFKIEHARGRSLALNMGTEEFGLIAGAAAEGTIFTDHADPRGRAEAAPVVERFRASGFEPEGDTLYAYAAVQVWAQAAEQAGSLELPAMIASLREHRFDTVLGPIDFDEKGDLTVQSPAWYVWRDGAYVPLEPSP